MYTFASIRHAHTSYDVIFVAGEDEILERFKDFNARVVFSAEGFCWPDQSLAVSCNVHIPGAVLSALQEV